MYMRKRSNVVLYCEPHGVDQGVDAHLQVQPLPSIAGFFLDFPAVWSWTFCLGIRGEGHHKILRIQNLSRARASWHPEKTNVYWFLTVMPRGVVKKNNGLFTVRLTVGVDPPLTVRVSWFFQNKLTFFDLFYHFKKGEIGPIFPHLLMVRLPLRTFLEFERMPNGFDGSLPSWTKVRKEICLKCHSWHSLKFQKSSFKWADLIEESLPCHASEDTWQCTHNRRPAQS